MSALERNRTLPLTERLEWRLVEEHCFASGAWDLRRLFAAESDRGDTYVAEACGWYLDYSKQRVSFETLRLLIHLATACGLPQAIQAMQRGDHVNATEGRAALHVALRAPPNERYLVEGRDVSPQVHSVLSRMIEFCDRVRSGEWKGYTGRRIVNVVNIGIGGSDLGPVMAFEALRHYGRRDIAFRFVSNVDSTDMAEALRTLDPAETLFIICSKSFTTLETMVNARAARAWCVSALGDQRAIARHFVAASANTAAVTEFGIDEQNMFEFWDWVGGRYSMDSAVGLSTMLSVGSENFLAMLKGFHDMDVHFRDAPFDSNLPVIQGLIGVWNTNFLGAATVAVLPYDQYLKRFPAYLQQLAMESNGKHVTVTGDRVRYSTGPVYWGEPATNGQHSFYQLIHQGTQIVPCDFIGFCRLLNPASDQHDLLMANLFAQGEALAFGRSTNEALAAGIPVHLAAHRSFEGNRPSSTLLAERLTPASLGALVALYEHSVYVQSVVWGIDAFDQWGVELGKTAARRTESEIAQIGEPDLHHDSSTNALIRRYRRRRVATT